MKNKVVIVGGGMIGAATAIKLAKQGAEVRILEQHCIEPNELLASDKVDIRISAINRFTETFLDELGAMPILRKSRVAAYKELEVYESLHSKLSFHADTLNTSHLGYLIENSLIQASLWSQFENYQITVEQVDDLPLRVEQQDDNVTLFYQNQHYTADLLVAADGGRSKIRELAGIGVTGWQYNQDCMGILIKTNAPQQSKTWQQFKSSGPIAFLPMQAPYANLIWYDDADVLRRLKQLSNEQLKDEIISHFFDLPFDFTVEENAVFPISRQHANQYSQGRIVLVGDSAHTINPLAGQGVNLGFKDIAALAETLGESNDIGCRLSLHKYERARRLENLSMMSMMDACYFGFSNDIKPLKHIRNLTLKLANSAELLKKHVLEHAIGQSNLD